MAKLTLFNYDRPGKGIRKDAPQKKGLALYFDIFFRRFWKLITLNLLYVIASLPALIIAWYISFHFVAWSATLAEMNIEANVVPLVILSIIIGIILLLVCGTGPATAAMFYVLRKYVGDSHAWPASDFLEHFKVNFKQGLAAYFIAIATSMCLLFSFNFYNYTLTGISAAFFRATLLTAMLLFIFVQFYVYRLMACYKMKLRHIYKSALILAIAQFGLNIATVCVGGLIAFIGLFLIAGMSLGGYIFLGLFMFSLVYFTQIFMTDIAIRKALRDPSVVTDLPEEYVKDEMFE